MSNTRTDCRICHGISLELILRLAPTPIGDQFLLEPKDQPLHPVDLYQCQDCGLAQLLYEIQPEEIYKDYLYLTGSSRGLDDHFAQYARRVATICNLNSEDVVCDIGSNDGTLLKHFKNLGMRVYGIEPSAHIAKIARANGIPTQEGYFKKGMGFGKANLITANNVVANIADLDAFMEGVVDLLASDGNFVFESFYLGDVVRNMVFDFIYHEHLSAFSVKPVKALMRRYGLAVYHVEHLNIAFLSEAKAQGKTIAGFGASISTTTLTYHFRLGSFLDYLVDDNPAKQGRLSPGLHLPVYPTSELYKRHPDYVLALAWRFAKDFQAAHPQFNLIVPLPVFQCIRA